MAKKKQTLQQEVQEEVKPKTKCEIVLVAPTYIVVRKEGETTNSYISMANTADYEIGQIIYL